MLSTLKECKGDLESWFGRTMEEFDELLRECRASGNVRRLRAALKEFEKPLQQAARKGIESSYAWQIAARAATLTGAPPARQLAWFARAYELTAKQQKEHSFDDVESNLGDHFNLADSLYEMARLHEAGGDLKQAAKLYQRSLQHLQDAADQADAETNDEKPGVPRRPQYLASLERVKKLLG